MGSASILLIIQVKPCMKPFPLKAEVPWQRQDRSLRVSNSIFEMTSLKLNKPISVCWTKQPKARLINLPKRAFSRFHFCGLDSFFVWTVEDIDDPFCIFAIVFPHGSDVVLPVNVPNDWFLVFEFYSFTVEANLGIDWTTSPC